MNLKCWSSCMVALSMIGFMLANTHFRNAADSKPMLSETLSFQDPSINRQTSVVGPIRNVRFTLFDAGIRPNELRIKAGLVNIHIEDRTNTSQGVTIQRVAGSERVALGAVQKEATEFRGRSSFRLAPGQYELIDAARPANKALLLVEP